MAALAVPSAMGYAELAGSVLSFAAAGSADAAELAAMLALLVGACFALALVLRLGWDHRRDPG